MQRRGAHVMHAFCDIGHLPPYQTPSLNQPGRLLHWQFREWSWCRAVADRLRAAASRDCSIRPCRMNGDHGNLERLISDKYTREKQGQ